MVGWGPVVRPGEESQGPCRLVPAGAGALHQLADERARVRSARPEERGPGRPLVRPDRSALRNGRYGPRDEADETHGALKGARPSGWMRSPTPGNPDASSVPHPHERW